MDRRLVPTFHPIVILSLTWPLLSRCRFSWHTMVIVVIMGSGDWSNEPMADLKIPIEDKKFNYLII